MAAARKVSQAASNGRLPLRLNTMRELRGGGGFAGAIDADNRNHRDSAGARNATSGLLDAETFFHFALARSRKHRGPRRLGFRRLSLTASMICVVIAMPRSAPISAASSSSSDVAVELRRTRDDAFDLVSQLAVGLLQAGFEFVEEAHGSVLTNSAAADSWQHLRGSAPSALSFPRHADRAA